MMQPVLLLSGREAERFTVEFESNMLLVVDFVRLWTVVWFSSKKSGR